MRSFCYVLLPFLCSLSVGAQEPSVLPPAVAPAAVPTAESPAVPAVRSVLSVLAYEHIAAGEEKEALSAEAFARQLDYLLKNGLTPISAAQFSDWRAGRAELPPHAVLLTLDEAERAVYDVAFPLLRERGIPFVLFVDARNWEQEADRLTPEQLREMQAAGCTIGSRSATRPAVYEWQFAAISGEEEAMAERELGQFGAILRETFGACELFAYPGGEEAPQLPALLGQFGYRAAFGRSEGKVTRKTSAFRLPRTLVRTDADFARAVNFGKAANTAEILAALAGHTEKEAEPEEVPAPAPALTFEDDDEAEEVDEAETTPAPELRYNRLVRRNGGDWETAQFTAPLVPREQTRVAVLGYHNFSNVKPVSEMRMRTSEFCTQMQYIKDAGLSVITMEDFLQWLRGERQLPERCILITIDDGWKSVWTDAYPVLKAYGYPFTTFLYTRYIQVQGDSMTKAQIQEMAAHGATIGSHSTNHLYPKSWRRLAQGSEAYTAQVKREILDSRDKLVGFFGNCSAYCYPGGFNTPPMLEALRTSAYRAAFTVLEAKVTTEEDPYLVHRYMVFGNDSSIFRRSVNFDGQAGVKPAQEGIRAAESRARAFFPAAFPTAP